MNKKKIFTENILVYAVLTVVLAITVFPLFYTIASSFKTNIEIFAAPARIIPEHPTWDNYIQAWNSESFNVPRLLSNSVLYTVVNVFVTIAISAMCGYVFARGHFHFKKIIFACFTALMFIKVGGIGVYATFKVLSAVRLDRSLLSLMIVNCFSIPIVQIYLVKGNVESLPIAIEEAAKIDGCSFVRVFLNVVLPLLKPIIATIAILAFQGSWNEYLLPNIFTLTSPDQRTLIVGLMALKNTGEAASSWNLMLAGASIAMFPVLAAFAVGNRYFVKGIAAGAVKG